ncbi:MAG: long-chain-fatty-acid--CoA ligase [Acidaminococcaceae bacterium]|nr:long-chain-fatty-acid--CoA ligase [Acidaminococcaceae bacterium]
MPYRLYNEIILGKKPDSPALIFRDRTITFGELEEKVNRWAAALQAKGVKKGDKVGLFSKNCDGFVVAYFAVVKAGGVVVPFNFQLTPKEVAFIVKDTGMKLLLNREHMHLGGALADIGVDWPLVQITFAEMDNVSADKFTDPGLVGNDCCAIIYTSGTTGRPKGAMLSHRNLLANMESCQKIVRTTTKDRNVTMLPMYHAFAWTCSVALGLQGGSVNVILENFTFSEAIQQLIKHKVTTFYGVPAMLSLLIKGIPPDMIANLRLVVTGGAPLPRSVIDDFYEKFHVLPQEGYGLSEASPVCAVNPTGKVKAGSIGKDLPDVELSLMDKEGSFVTVSHQVGELCVRGENVMLGYLNRPEDTARTIVDGWLHTGDIAYRDEEGYYFIVDRLKDLIISAGENIYPREIEEELMLHPDIAEASVVGIPDKLRGQCACAYIVLKKGSQLDKKSVRKYLLGRIATYKVPRECVFVEGLPRNNTGKVVKKALRERALMDLHLKQ